MDDGPVMESISQCSHLSPGDAGQSTSLAAGGEAFLSNANRARELGLVPLGCCCSVITGA